MPFWCLFGLKKVPFKPSPSLARGEFHRRVFCSRTIFIMSTTERRPMRPAWASKGTGSFGTPKRIGTEYVETQNSDCDLFNEGVPVGNNQTYSRRTSRKCVIRFTKDELLALRKPTKVLIEMSIKLPKNIVMDCSQLPESKTMRMAMDMPEHPRPPAQSAEPEQVPNPL